MKKPLKKIEFPDQLKDQVNSIIKSNWNPNKIKEEIKHDTILNNTTGFGNSVSNPDLGSGFVW